MCRILNILFSKTTVSPYMCTGTETCAEVEICQNEAILQSSIILIHLEPRCLKEKSENNLILLLPFFTSDGHTSGHPFTNFFWISPKNKALHIYLTVEGLWVLLVFEVLLFSHIPSAAFWRCLINTFCWNCCIIISQEDFSHMTTFVPADLCLHTCTYTHSQVDIVFSPPLNNPLTYREFTLIAKIKSHWFTKTKKGKDLQVANPGRLFVTRKTSNQTWRSARHFDVSLTGYFRGISGSLCSEMEKKKRLQWLKMPDQNRD